MKKQMWQGALILAVGLGLTASMARANHITVTNVKLVTPRGMATTAVQFDLRWENSWRASWNEPGVGIMTNWDAAWVFIKYRVTGGIADTNWHPAWLSASGHTAPAGTTIAVGTNGGATNVGAFIYRSEAGSGTFTNSKVRLCWNYAANGLTRTNPIDVSVHAIEMVYIPQGSFYVGDGTTANIQGHFEAGTNGTPFLITNESYQITLGGGAAGSLGNHNSSAMAGTDDFNNATSRTLPEAFPKGYNAFYCMKYELTQGQYTEFLNSLTYTQATNRAPGSTGSSRQTIGTNTLGNYTNGAPDRAVNYMGWADVAAYADWAGLRPMTELEFEKACRGPKTAVSNEYAWGDTNITQQTGHIGTDGSGTETASPATANCYYDSELGAIQGPVRVGIYATSNSIRRLAGAGYYGVMELSGNLNERLVTVGKGTGRAFTGMHGDGVLTSGGDANVSNWPGSDDQGFGFRGGGWVWVANDLRVSSRYVATYTYSARDPYRGWHGVRSVP